MIKATKPTSSSAEPGSADSESDDSEGWLAEFIDSDSDFEFDSNELARRMLERLLLGKLKIDFQF